MHGPGYMTYFVFACFSLSRFGDRLIRCEDVWTGR